MSMHIRFTQGPAWICDMYTKFPEVYLSLEEVVIDGEQFVVVSRHMNITANHQRLDIIIKPK